MKRLPIVALSFLVAALPVCAQHNSGGHSSAGAVHAAPSFHSAPIQSHYMGSSTPFGMSPARSAPIGDRRREGYRGTRGYNYPGVIGYIAYPYISQPYYDDSAYASTPDVPESVANPDPGTEPSGPNPADNPNAYDPQSAPQAAANTQSPAEIYRPAQQPAAPPAPEQTITLIFKDGRPPQQIQNYIATRTTITVINGQRHHDIPVADLDVPATIAANQDNGNGFQIPGTTR